MKQTEKSLSLSICLSVCLCLSLSLSLSLSLRLSHLHVVTVGVLGVGGTVCVVWVLDVREFPRDCLTTAEGSLLSVDGFIPICGILKVHVIINPTTFEL